MLIHKTYSFDKHIGSQDAFSYINFQKNIYTTFSHHLCAFNKGESTCGGDSGGPLFLLENGR